MQFDNSALRAPQRFERVVGATISGVITTRCDVDDRLADDFRRANTDGYKCHTATYAKQSHRLSLSFAPCCHVAFFQDPVTTIRRLPPDRHHRSRDPPASGIRLA